MTVRQARECARGGCSHRYDPWDRQTGTPKRYCSIECYRLDKAKPEPVKRVPLPQRPSAKRPKAISPASPAQRTAIKDRACIVCGQHAGHCHPAHLIDRSLAHDGDGDQRAVVPLCPEHHRSYDDGFLSLLEHLEPHWRSEMAFAVERHGLLRTLQRVTNTHWVPVEREAEAA